MGLKISAPGSGGGEQRGAIISLCFSLNTVMDLATSLWACLGHWWQGRVSKRRDRDCFPTPHHPRLVHLVVQQARDALISEQKQLKCCCPFLPSWEWLQDGKEYKASSRTMTVCKVWWRQRDSRQPCASPWIQCDSSESGLDCQYRQAQSKSWMSTLVQTCQAATASLCASLGQRAEWCAILAQLRFSLVYLCIYIKITASEQTGGKVAFWCFAWFCIQ